MSMRYIRDTYRVPARRGARVRFTGVLAAELSAPSGTVTGSRGAMVRIRVDGERRARIFHPTFDIEYADATSGASTR